MTDTLAHRTIECHRIGALVLPIAVFGAAGHTGRFVAAELQRREIQPILIGRDCKKLEIAFPESSTCRIASIDDPLSLDAALQDVSLVINCAGPFLDTADAVITAALRAGAHYLDITAEQASVQSTFERYATAARDRGIVVVPGMGFYGGFGDLIVTVAAGERNVEHVDIAIALSSWQPTRGTRLTGDRNTAQRLVLVDGELVPFDAKSPKTHWEFRKPFGVQQVVEVPLSETILIARHLHARNVHTYINAAPLRDLDDISTPPPEAIDDKRRSAQTFIIDVVVQTSSGERRATVSGRDIYAITAPLVVEAALRIIGGPARSGGVYAPGELFDARALLETLTQHDVSLRLPGA